MIILQERGNFGHYGLPQHDREALANLRI